MKKSIISILSVIIVVMLFLTGCKTNVNTTSTEPTETQGKYTEVDVESAEN